MTDDRVISPLMTIPTAATIRLPRRAVALLTAFTFVCGTASPVFASDDSETAAVAAEPLVSTAALIPEGVIAPSPALYAAALQDPAGGQALHAGAVSYSDAYQLRRKIHKISSFATLPLFATEIALGQSMYNSAPSDQSSMRGAHAAVGVATVALFGVNTVTGAWNLFGEGRHDPNGRTLRLVHGLLMMAADVGFVATTATGPNSHSIRQAASYESNKVTHRNIAVASISVASASYLLMLFGNR